MAKLTLSVDDRVVKRAKRFARERGVSISSMVENYLATVAGQESQPEPDGPVLRSLRGILKKADIEDYRKHLVEKYR